MPFLATPNATMYYDIFEPDFTTLPFPYQMHTVLLIHGFGGSPESDFGGQLAALRSHFRVIAPHLHGYGRSTQRSSYALSFYRDDAADLATLLDTLDIDKVLVLGFTLARKTPLTAGLKNWPLSLRHDPRSSVSETIKR